MFIWAGLENVTYMLYTYVIIPKTIEIKKKTLFAYAKLPK